MPPRRRTFYLADATLLSNPKVLRLQRTHPDDWLAALGAFHVLIGVATLNGSPKLTKTEIGDVLGGRDDLVSLLRGLGLLTSSGISKPTYDDWCPKPRPTYPSDKKPRPTTAESGTTPSDSGGVRRDSGGIPHDSDGIPTSTTTSSTGSTSTPRGVDALTLRDEEDRREAALRVKAPRLVAHR